MREPIKTVLLDFDGTLVDTAPDLIRTTNLFLKDEGQRELSDEAIRVEIGYGLKNLMLETFPKSLAEPQHLAQLERRYLEIYDQEYLKSPTLFPGAKEFLTSWNGKIAIVSNKRERYIHAILKHLSLDKLPWSAIIGGDTFPQMKPHPTPFLEAMKNAGTDHANTVMVGDGHPDIEGALAVGIASIAVSFGYSPLEQLVHLGATSTVDSFFELHDVLKTW